MAEAPKNRRQFVRIYRNFILSFHLKDKKEVVYEMSQVNNISRGGVNFSSTVKFEQNSVLIIELRTPFLSDKIVLEGFVIDSREKIANLIYEVRVQFQNLSPQAVEILAKIERYAPQEE